MIPKLHVRTVNKEYYLDVLGNFGEAIQRKLFEFLKRQLMNFATTHQNIPLWYTTILGKTQNRYDVAMSVSSINDCLLTFF